MTDTQNFLVPVYYNINTPTIFNSIFGSSYDNLTIPSEVVKNFALNANYFACNGNQKVCITNIQDNISASITKSYKFMDYTNPNITEQYLYIDVSCSLNPGKLNIGVTSSYYQQYFNNTISVPLNPTNKSYGFGPVSLNPYGLMVTGGQTHSVDLYLTYTANDTTKVQTIGTFYVVDSPSRFRNPTSQSCADMIAVDIKSCDIGMPLYTIDSISNQNTSIGGIIDTMLAFSSSLSYKNIYSIISCYKEGTNVLYSNTDIWADSSTKRNYFKSGALNFRAQPLVFANAKSLYNGITVALTTSCKVWIYGAVQTNTDIGRFEISSSVGSTYIDISSSTPNWYSAELPIETELPFQTNQAYLPRFISAITGNIDINTWKPVHTSGYFKVWTVQIFDRI